MFWDFIKLGISHVIPYGFDHILFIVLLFFSSSDLRKSLIICTVFTVAHSITLLLAFFNLVQYETYWVELFIAFSILFMGLQNLIGKKWYLKNILIIFLFGLVHGLGFASYIMKIQFQPYLYFYSILGFNLGIEIAQILIILFCFYLISKPFKKKPWYQLKIVNSISIFATSIAVFWIIQRILN